MISFSFVFREDPFSVVKPRGGVISNIELIKSLSEFGDIFIFIPGREFSFYKSERQGVSINFVEFVTLPFPFFVRKGNKQLNAFMRRHLASYEKLIFFGSKGSIPHACQFYKHISSDNKKLTIITRDYNELPLKGRLYGKGGVRDLIRDAFFYLIWRRAYRIADNVIVNSSFLAQEIAKVYRINRFFVFHPKIKSVATFERDRLLDAAHLKAGFISGPKYKGLSLVLQLSVLFPEIEFHVFNADKNTTKVNNKNVVLHGYESHDNIFQLIDVLLAPSYWYEPYGRVAAESILHGVPVLHSNRGGLSEASGSSFFSVESMRIETWAKKLTDFIENISDYNNELETCKYRLIIQNADNKFRDDLRSFIKVNFDNRQLS
ncbi:glycosyltransferase [Idiomarina zobellii]|uniref:Glycosyl transferase family 1 domain-containing protein n=1 Tax=Idiomarina zobellii TaxID=86103 RepID=A0A837NF25_9GAMM|nr:glycosyltransferase [Idiomarina zobellii]KPD22104.1 hypothetical protein AFK76_11285 [Idiomarina zobellii]SDG22831.1 Glycosyltransferase involved in cell wall bisynthesis [Idiomarina zobellii]